MSKGRILVIDDQARTLARTMSALVEEGFEVVGTASDAEVIARLQSGNYDLLLLNTRSPRARTEALLSRDTEPQPATVLLLRPAGADAPIGIISGFALKVVSLSRLPEMVKQAVIQAQSLREAARTELVTPLAELGQVVSSAAEFSQLLTSYLEKLAKMTTAEHISLMLWDKDTQQLSSRSVFPARSRVPIPEPALQKLARRTAEKAQSSLFLDGGTMEPEIQQELSQGNVVSAFSLPLLVRNKVVGVANFLKFKGGPPFAQYDVHCASAFSGTLALALENIQLVGAMEQRKTALDEYLPQLERRQQEIRALNSMLQAQQVKMMELDEANRSFKAQYIAALRSLVALIETGDLSGQGASDTSARWAISLAQAMGISTEGLAEISYLHHIGLILPHLLPAKPAPGSEEAQKMVYDHPLFGEKLAEILGLPAAARLAIRHHHENYDGSGYPDGLRGDKIPVNARLMRVIDDYLSMTSQGTLRGEAVLAQIRAGAGREYDPTIVSALLKLAGKKEVRPEVEIVSTVSHELRSPLTYLVGYSELLASQKDLAPSAQQAAQEIHNEATHMARIVEDLLDLSRFESGRIELKLEPVDLAGLVKHSIATAAIKSSLHQLETSLPPGLPQVKADPDRIRQVLDNLLGNAINYSPQGGEIVVKAELMGDKVRVSVADQGIGIPQDKMGMLFQKFYRVDSPWKNKVKGTGLGLALCKYFVEAHGGNIWVESEEGKGSIFYFTLPLWSGEKR